MAKNVMKIGILSKDDYRRRTITIAKGEYKPKKNEPTVWFESMESLGQVLSGQNQWLLRIIRDSAPGSLTELEETSGRKKIEPFQDTQDPYKLRHCGSCPGKRNRPASGEGYRVYG